MANDQPNTIAQQFFYNLLTVHLAAQWSLQSGEDLDPGFANSDLALAQNYMQAIWPLVNDPYSQ